MSTKVIQFGWGAASFAEQVPDLPKADAEAADADNAAIIRLSVRGILSEGERDRAIRRATKQIEHALQKHLRSRPNPHQDPTP